MELAQNIKWNWHLKYYWPCVCDALWALLVVNIGHFLSCETLIVYVNFTQMLIKIANIKGN